MVAQDGRSGAVLMVAWANREALSQTLQTGLAHYFSRSRGRLWRKGETSGHQQRLDQVRLDCDGDAVLYRVAQTGPACHTGQPTCFFQVVTDGRLIDAPPAPSAAAVHPLARLAATVAERARERPEGSYTAQLLDQGLAKVSQKVGEEAVEVVVAAHAEDDRRLASEAADLLYHLTVLLEARGVPLDTVLAELERRGA